MTSARARRRKWREVKRRPLQGNSPDDRMLRPDCDRLKRACADSFPTTPSPPLPKIANIPGRRFQRHHGIYRSDQARPIIRDWGRVPPPVGRPRSPAKRRAGRSAPCSSSTMSSDRYSLIGLLASMARLRFTGTPRLTRKLSPPGQNRTFLLCGE